MTPERLEQIRAIARTVQSGVAAEIGTPTITNPALLG